MEQNNVLSSWLETYFDEVTPIEFYRAIFPAGELEKQGEYVTGMYCGIAVEITRDKKPNGKPKIRRYSITDELDTVERLTVSDNFCLCSPISYAGKNRTADNARNLYAIAVDVDKIHIHNGFPDGLASLWNGHINEVGRIPKPTYIVSSGTGVHLYYVLDKPIPLFADTAKQLQALKRELTAKVWHSTVVNIHNYKEIQFEGIYQGFRMVGTITKNGSRARAFLTGDTVTLDYLNGFVKDGSRVERYTTKKELTKAKARELYPDWYERRIERGEACGVWHISRNLYDWWKREILEKGAVGHRYWCLMTLAVYAYKCGMYDPKHNPEPVTREELERDCMEIMNHFETLTDEETNHFTEADVLDALEAYDSKWIRYPRDTIEYRCGFPLPHNKRNGRKQTDHLERARAVQKVDYPNGEWRGRQPKQLTVQLWQATHPTGTKMQCHKDTGLSRTTIDKWWKKSEAEQGKTLAKQDNKHDT